MVDEAEMAQALRFYLQSQPETTLVDCLRDGLGIDECEHWTRSNQLWVTAQLRHYGYERVSVRRGKEVCRVWRRGPDSLRRLNAGVPEAADLATTYTLPIQAPAGMSRSAIEVCQWLERRHWTLQKACEVLDISMDTLRAWRSGKKPVPRMAQLAMRWFDLQSAACVTKKSVEGVDNPPAPCSYTLHVDDDESTRSTPDDTQYPSNCQRDT